jgi:quercetin dioxygenase-like cupin family protein
MKEQILKNAEEVSRIASEVRSMILDTSPRYMVLQGQRGEDIPVQKLKENADCGVYYVFQKQGSVGAKHTHTESKEHFICVSGIVSVNGYELTPGMSTCIPAGTPHNCEAFCDCEYLAITVPVEREYLGNRRGREK